jgi:hypothetical protein
VLKVYDLNISAGPCYIHCGRDSRGRQYADVNGNIKSSPTNKGTSAEGWSDNWLILEDKADDTEDDAVTRVVEC